MSALLTVDEATALAEHEQVIERGIQTFTEVGNALLKIRDGRLYRADFGTFEDYCRERWSFSARRAGQLIEAAAIGTIVPVENEGQARELARVPEPERADVWRETVERTNGKPTAAAIRATYRPDPEPEPEPDGPDHDDKRPEPGIWYGGPTAQSTDEAAALKSVHTALDEHVPDSDGEARAWRRQFLAALSTARKPLQFRTADVAERADDECIDELARFVADLNRYWSAVESTGGQADVIQIGDRR